MRKRRRPSKEIHFSFDSFLDVVANVVGIIIRLILVAWVGARTYQGIQIPNEIAPRPALSIPGQSHTPETIGMAQANLDKLQKDRDSIQASNQLKTGLLAKEKTDLGQVTQKTNDLQKGLEQIQNSLDLTDQISRDLEIKGKAQKSNRDELLKRTTNLENAIKELKAKKGPATVIKYQTPISRALQAEEMIFECRNGKIMAVDIGAMMEEISDRMQELGEKLRTQWEVEETTRTHGPFKLRYTLERERTAIELANPNLPPNDRTNFRFALTGWVLEPLDQDRGETLDEALSPNSEFLKIVLGLDPSQTAVTFCVYPDSFPLYRRLRDLLHEKNIVVAGRPLVKEAPIAMSTRKGTASRGQ